jgi:outer membrane murein-binding lipoprotein Lpp
MLFVLGGIMFIPVVAFHSPLIPFDSDSANLQSSIRFVQRHGIRNLVEMQEVILPHLVLGPALLAGGTSATMILSIASVQTLAATISYLAWKLSRSAAASFGAVLSLMAFQSILRRASLLPMYPTMLAFGFMGVYLAHRTIGRSGAPRRTFAIFSGLCLILAMEAHPLGQLFVLVPPFLLVTAPLRAAVGGLWRVYAAATCFYIPRAVVNLMDGGLSHFLLNRVDFWVTQGHLLSIQEDFLMYPSRYDFFGYLSDFTTRVVQDMRSPLGLMVIGLTISGLFLARGRQRWFGPLAFSFVTAVALYREAPAFSKYFSPQLVGLALAAGLTIGLMWRRRSVLIRGIGAAALVVLLTGGWLNFANALRTTRIYQQSILSGPLPSLAGRIEDGKGVIGARAIHLGWVDPEIEVYSGFFLREEEFVTFLTWPSDRAVMDVLERHDIGWVLVNPDHALETAYHEAWIRPAYGLPVRHLRALEGSRSFCVAAERDGYVLYRLGICS